MQSFVYNAQAARVLFGAGKLAQVAQEAQWLNMQRALVLCTPEQTEQAQQVADLLGSSAVGVHHKAVMHVPIETVRDACHEVQRLRVDGLVAYGGGSTTGLAKAIALETGLPILAIPTSYAGSEMTSIYGITESGVKKTGKDARVLPRSVIYDPDLTLSLPVGLSVTSGMNALAHAAEGLYAQDRNPMTRLMAMEGISSLAKALPMIKADSQHAQGRALALYGAWLCGSVLGSVGMALHHKLCHTLGGSFNLPHAEVHTVVLPHALAFNASAAPQAMQDLAQSLGVTDGPLGVYLLAKNNGALVALKDIGMKASDLDLAADLAVTSPYWNPRPFGLPQRDDIRALLQRAFDGNAPGT
jgi:alcohol dehydrogenase class IV